MDLSVLVIIFLSTDCQRKKANHLFKKKKKKMAKKSVLKKRVMNLVRERYNRIGLLKSRVERNWYTGDRHRKATAELLAGRDVLKTRQIMPLMKDVYNLSKSLQKEHLWVNVPNLGTFFEKKILEKASHDERQQRISKHRKRDDMPMLHENPYSVTTDFQMGKATRVLDIQPIIKGRIRFDDYNAVTRIIHGLSAKHKTVGSFLKFLENDENGYKTGQLFDKYGALFTHVELLCRQISSQEERRRVTILKNRRGVLTTERNERIYSLPGCYTLRKNVHISPDTLTSDVNWDSSSWGARAWYYSDFGTQPGMLQKEMDKHMKYKPDDSVLNSRNPNRAVNAQGGRAVLNSRSLWKRI